MSQTPDEPQEPSAPPPKPVKRVLILGRDTQLGSNTPADFVEAPSDTPPPDLETAGKIPEGFGITFGNRLTLEEEDPSTPRRPSLSPEQQARKQREAARSQEDTDFQHRDTETQREAREETVGEVSRLDLLNQQTVGEMSQPARVSKAMTLDEAIRRFVPDAGIDTLAVGGMHMHNTPMALVREMLRQGKHVRRLIGGLAGNINVDLLIGAGLVQEVVASYIGFEHLGLAPAFRRKAQAGEVRMVELDELALLSALRAGAWGLPFAALPYGARLSDLPSTAPDYYMPVTDPFTGKPTLAVPPIVPDVAFVVAAEADEYGNCVVKGSVFTDKEIAFAARRVIVQAERIVPSAQIARNPTAVFLPAVRVSAVVAAPFSCHPTAHHRFYRYDEAHLKEYQQLAATVDGFAQYLEKYEIVAGKGEIEYLGHTQLVG